MIGGHEARAPQLALPRRRGAAVGNGRRVTGPATLSGWGCPDSRFCRASPGGRKEEAELITLK